MLLLTGFRDAILLLTGLRDAILLSGGDLMLPLGLILMLPTTRGLMLWLLALFFWLPVGWSKSGPELTVYQIGIISHY